MQCDIHQLGRLLREDNHNLQGTATNNLDDAVRAQGQ